MSKCKLFSLLTAIVLVFTNFAISEKRISFSDLYGENSGGNPIQEFYQNGNLKYEGWLKDGQKDGFWKFYYPNMVLKMHGDYQDGVRVNWWEEYYPDGKIKSEGLFSEGKRIDFWTFYYEKGNIHESGFFRNGMKVGFWRTFENGKVVAETKF